MSSKYSQHESDPVLVGRYHMGSVKVDVCAIKGIGGDFITADEGTGRPSVRVGVDAERFEDLTSVLLHEASELAMVLMDLRWLPSNATEEGSDSYLFVINHPQFSEVCARVGPFFYNALPDLRKYYGRRKAQLRRKKKRKK